MFTTDNEFLIALRAVYIQSANSIEAEIKAKQQQRAAWLDLAARIKKRLEMDALQENKTVVKLPKIE
jgi:hypothetical protein